MAEVLPMVGLKPMVDLTTPTIVGFIGMVGLKITANRHKKRKMSVRASVKRYTTTMKNHKKSL